MGALISVSIVSCQGGGVWGGVCVRGCNTKCRDKEVVIKGLRSIRGTRKRSFFYCHCLWFNSVGDKWCLYSDAGYLGYLYTIYLGCLDTTYTGCLYTIYLRSLNTRYVVCLYTIYLGCLNTRHMGCLYKIYLGCLTTRYMGCLNTIYLGCLNTKMGCIFTIYLGCFNTRYMSCL